MGGCISQGKMNKSNIIQPKKPKQPKIQNSQTKDIGKIIVPIVQPPKKVKYKQITSYQFLLTYRVQYSLDSSTKIQGPKYISNYIDGSCKIMRIIQIDDIIESRLNIYKQILNLQIFQDQQSNLLILDQYYCGLTIIQLAKSVLEPNFQEIIMSYIKQVYDIIVQFHSEGIYLGNLQLTSFITKSPFDNTIKLVDFNLNGSTPQLIGFAHKEGPQVDWQFYGYLIKYVTSKLTPIFIQHKMQYTPNESQIVNQLLRGKKIDKTLLSELIFIQVPSAVYYGYKFRKDVNQLLRMRKKRKPHSIKYYDQISSKAIKGKSLEEVLYKIQTQRIIKRIQSYIINLTNECEQPFMMYCNGGEKLKKLKQVFILKQENKKIDQLKQVIMTIR